ncbi:hypothetical protein LMG28140_01317 [Paraburkholderia metrosideri]|uniref:Uncharacterized protein n=1 Tax=Paraburkholderia metrosideri TaxID=580937 RepID=A0ABN7HLT1_9BURK|nr:hypothetical protein LMG28140_01317 [Paraburkholderia metrosideri]
MFDNADSGSLFNRGHALCTFLDPLSAAQKLHNHALLKDDSRTIQGRFKDDSQLRGQPLDLAIQHALVIRIVDRQIDHMHARRRETFPQ